MNSKIITHHIEASTENSVTLNVEANTEYQEFHECKWKIKMQVGSNVVYSEETAVRTSIYIYGGFHITLSGLSPGTFYVAKLTVLKYDTEEGKKWETDSEVLSRVIATKGRTEYWDWNKANYSLYHPTLGYGYDETGEFYEDIGGTTHSALSYFNATAEQTKSAYKAITTGGRISDFPATVWNDFVDRVARVQEEWGKTARLDNSWPNAYVSSMDPVYREWPIIGDMLHTAGRTITARIFNEVVEAIPITVTWPWEAELGRKKIKPNDICKGSYFVTLANALNHWISLTPYPFVISDMFSHSMSGKTIQIPSVQFAHTGNIPMSFSFIADSVPAVQAAHSSKIGVLSDAFELQVETNAMPFTSEFNFFYHESTCSGAVVSGYVIGKFDGYVSQPTDKFAFNYTDGNSHKLTLSDSIQGISNVVDLTAPVGCAIGEHGYTLRTAAQFQIGSAVSLYLEHNGIFGVVNSFTITPRDNDQSILDGTIGVSSDIDGMLTEPGAAMEHSKQLTMTDSFVVSTSTGNIMGQDSQIRISGTSDFTVSNIVPLEFSGSTGFSATVDNIRMGKIYEIVDGSANVTIKPTSGVSVINTIDLGSTNTRVGFSAAAENNTNNPVELTGGATASIVPYKSTLNGQKDVIVSSSVRNAVKSDSEVDISKYRIVDGSANVTIKPTSGVGTTKPIKIESTEILITGKSTGEMVYKPFVAMPMGSAIIGNFTAAGIEAIDMAHARTTSVDAKILSGGSGNLTVSKGQKEIETQHIESIDTAAVMSFTAPAPLNGSETIRINVVGEADKSSGLALENESETVLIRFEATVSKATVSLILASELEDTLVSDIEDTLAYDAERIVRTIDDDKSNTK